MSNQRILVIVLSALLIIALGYIGFNWYSNSKTQKELAIYQSGAQYGYQYATVQLIQQLATCNQVPVFANNGTTNVTLHAIAVECLQQGQQNQTK